VKAERGEEADDTLWELRRRFDERGIFGFRECGRRINTSPDFLEEALVDEASKIIGRDAQRPGVPCTDDLAFSSESKKSIGKG
jgi:hypothetical protein